MKLKKRAKAKKIKKIEVQDQVRRERNDRDFSKALEEGRRAYRGGEWLLHSDVQEVLNESGIKENAETRLQTAEFVDMLKETVVKTPQHPDDYLIQLLKLTGTAKDGYVEFNGEFVIEVIENSWVKIPLLSKNIALCSSEINYTVSRKRKRDSGEGDEEKEVADHEDFEEGSAEKACLGVMTRGYYLVTKKKGVYTVKLDFLHDYASKSETGVDISVPLSKLTELAFSVPGKSIQMKVDPALNEVVSYSEADVATTISCVVPPSTDISIQWTILGDKELYLEGEEEEEQVAEIVEAERYTGPPQFTSEQDTLYTYGDGTLSARTLFRYKIDRGALSKIEIELDSDVKILAVEGMAIRSWDVAKGSRGSSDLSSDERGAIDEEDDGSRGDEGATGVLRVAIEYGVEDTYELTLTSEREVRDRSSCELFRFSTKGAKREKGSLGLSPRTNVEVRLKDSVRLANLDASELPEWIQSTAESILYARRFLTPDFKLMVSIVQYDDHEVLTCSIDRAHFVSVYTEEGSLVYKMIFHIHNSQQQYLRINLPEAADIWSSTVAGNSVKLSTDRDGLTLLPLEKSSGAGDRQFACDIAFRVDAPAFRSSGRATVIFPEVDVPIGSLAVSSYFPDGYRYGEFSGDLREVPNFSFPSSVLQDGVRSKITQIRSEVAQEQIMYNDVDDEGDLNDEMDEPMPGGFGGVAGVLPVKVDLPKTNTKFVFESLFIRQKPLEINVRYRKPWQWWFSKRRLGYGYRCTLS